MMLILEGLKDQGLEHNKIVVVTQGIKANTLSQGLGLGDNLRGELFSQHQSPTLCAQHTACRPFHTGNASRPRSPFQPSLNAALLSTSS